MITVDRSLSLFEFCREARVDLILSLLYLVHVDTALQEALEFAELLESLIKRDEEVLADARLLLRADFVSQGFAEAFDSVDHVVDLDAVHQSGRVLQTGIDAVEFGIQLQDIRELPQVASLKLIPDVLVVNQVLHRIEPRLDFVGIGAWLLHPLLEQSTANLTLGLVEHSIKTARCPSRHVIVLWEDVHSEQSSTIQLEVRVQRVPLHFEVLLALLHQAKRVDDTA